jgi:mRNA interferase RelE/StbE
MTYKISFSRTALKFYFDMQPKQFKQMARALYELTQDPFPEDSRELKGYAGFYRKDVGEFRVVYGVEAECVLVDVIDKRNDDEVYKSFKRRR